MFWFASKRKMKTGSQIFEPEPNNEEIQAGFFSIAVYHHTKIMGKSWDLKRHIFPGDKQFKSVIMIMNHLLNCHWGFFPGTRDINCSGFLPHVPAHTSIRPLKGCQSRRTSKQLLYKEPKGNSRILLSRLHNLLL